MKKFAWLLLLMTLLVACAGRSESRGIAVNYVNYESNSLNISFEYPEGWMVEEGEGEINVASEAQLLQEQNFTSGGVANITTLSNEFITNDLVGTLSQFVGFMAEGENSSVVSEASAMTINGRDAAQSTLQVTIAEDMEATMVVTLILGQSQSLLIAAAYDEAPFGEMLNHITESITIAD